MTSDGIQTRDWNRIWKCAADIANLAAAGRLQEMRLTEKQLLSELRILESKYGRLPSILATRADYIPSLQRRVRLLEEAFSKARSAGDLANCTIIAGSLAALLIERMKDKRRGDKWLRELGGCLSRHWDGFESREHARLSKMIKSQLEIPLVK